MSKCFKQILVNEQGDLPLNPGGTYITNLGSLAFDGYKFIMSGHKTKTYTVVEWYMIEIECAKAAPLKISK